MNGIKRKRGVIGLSLISIGLIGLGLWYVGISLAGGKAEVAIRPALTVTTAMPHFTKWPETFCANGNVAAWQESSIGSEIGGLRLAEVRVNVGDAVQRGEVLAVFDDVTVKADVAVAAATVTEAEAGLAEARANADRAREVKMPGVISAQQISEYLVAERKAAARLQSTRAQLNSRQTRLAQTAVTAPDDGVISSRSATLGAVTSTGQELFRLIRMDRLEWRAEVPSAELPFLRIGQKAAVTAPGDLKAEGRVRIVSPTVDAQTRMGLVYVDLPGGTALKAGMFAQGVFELGQKEAMAVPQSAVVHRDGFDYVYRLSDGSKVLQTKVTVGRRLDHRVEIVAGLDRKARVVTSGAAFLVDGDTVRVVDDESSVGRM